MSENNLIATLENLHCGPQVDETQITMFDWGAFKDLPHWETCEDPPIQVRPAGAESRELDPEPRDHNSAPGEVQAE